MSPAPFDFGELRSLLQQPPSAQVWEALCALVFPARWEKAADQWLPYAMDHLDRHWPDELRVLPLKWSSRKLPPSAAKLARQLHYMGIPRESSGLINMLALSRPQLTTAHVRCRYVDPAARLLEACASPQLRELELDGLFVPDGGAHMQAALAELAALIKLDTLTTVQGLALIHPNLSDDALDALLTSPKLAALRRVSITWLSHRSARALAGTLCSLAERLESLELSRNRYADPPALAFALAKATWPALRKLHIGGTEHYARGISAMLTAMPALRELALVDAALDGDAIDAIASSDATLTHLKLSYSQYAPVEVAALLRSTRCAGLRELELSSVRIDEIGGEAIWCGPMSQTLERLALRGPELGERAWRQLEDRRLPRLRELDLSGGALDAASARALASADLPALTLLNLSRLDTYDEALWELERAPWREHVTLIAPEQP